MAPGAPLAHLRRTRARPCSSSPRRALALQLALPNVHRSDAELRIARVPVVEVAADVAMCDGGGGSTGHPVEYIKLDLREGHAVNPCKYCGVRYRKKAGAHAH